MATRYKIKYVKVGYANGQFGWVYTTSGKLFYLWWEEAWPEEMSASDQVRYSMWVSLLRDAMQHNWDVEFITTSSSDSKAVTLKVYS